jgi:hypothetical protein
VSAYIREYVTNTLLPQCKHTHTHQYPHNAHGHSECTVVAEVFRVILQQAILLQVLIVQGVDR